MRARILHRLLNCDMVELVTYDTLIRYRHWFESSYRNRLQSLEAHVDGHSAFNGGVDGSRPSGGTLTFLPCWRNGSVFVLHAKGSGSIPLRGTHGDCS